jgi:hypothetical protein
VRERSSSSLGAGILDQLDCLGGLGALAVDAESQGAETLVGDLGPGLVYRRGIIRR